MPWTDCAFVDWEDCRWQDWDDCIWDKFFPVHRDRKTRTVRGLPPVSLSNNKRPYLEGNPSYVEDSLRSPDKSLADAIMQTRGEDVRHMEFKQPYRYDSLPKMKYRNEPAFAHHEMMSAQNLVETPADIVAGGKEVEYEWVWVRYFDDTRWTPTTGLWFDNRWLGTLGIFAIWNVDDKNADVSLSENGLVIGRTSGINNAASIRTTVGISSGKHYWEVTITNAGSHPTQGVNDILGIGLSTASLNSYPGGDADGYGYYSHNGKKINNGSQVAYGDAYTTGDVISFALDMDNGKIWFGKNGTWQASGDPAAGTNEAYSGLSGTFYAMANPYHTDSLLTGNFGASDFAYSPPSGFAGLRYGVSIDLSVLRDWWSNLRPRKFRMKFDNATADVSVKDTDGVAIYANGTYASEDEVDLTFAGADIDNLVVTGAGDLTDIEFEIQVEKGSVPERIPRTEVPFAERKYPPDPRPIKIAKKLPRRKQLRPGRYPWFGKGVGRGGGRTGPRASRS